MRCLAVDDEPLALNIVEGFCKKISYLELVAKCASAIEAAELIKHENIDLIFLDINMPHLTGIDFAHITPNMPMVIFTTAYPDYALTSYDLNAVDYLLKPFSFDRFFKAVNKAQDIYIMKSGRSSTVAPSVSDHIMVRMEYSTVKIMISDILFIEGLKDYVKIVTDTKNYVTKSSMKNVEEKLPHDKFVRTHKSYIVNLDHVDAFENNHVILGKNKLPLGSGNKEIFLDFLEKSRL